MSSRLQELRRSHRSSVIASERAEILDLIDKLNAKRLAPAGGRDQRRGTPSGTARRPASARPRAPASTEPSMSNSGIAPLLRSLEVRIGILEDHVLKAKRNSSRPAPPVSQQRIADLASYTFAGVIQGQMLSDMLQLVSSNTMSGMFAVEDDDSSCQLFFEEGRICHAQAGKLSGESAFFAAFAFASGRYFFRETTDLPKQRTINSSTQFLILEALRKIDESTAEG